MQTVKSLVIATIILLHGLGMAQTPTPSVTSGIYLTAVDYEKHKLMEEVECKKEHEDFKTHDWFDRQSFEVLYKGKKTTYLKSNIYAYRDCSNKTWRFFNNKEYEILEIRDICVYKINKVVMNGIAVEKDFVYFFSKGLMGDIKELSKKNLKTVFANNKEFCQLIDTEIKDDDEEKVIHRYDTGRKMYYINYLFSKTSVH